MTKTKRANLDTLRQQSGEGDNIKRLVELTIAEPDTRSKPQRGHTPPLLGSVAHFYNSHALDKKTTNQLKEILPDLDYAKLLLVSSVMSPLDMLSTDVTFGIRDSSLPLPLVEAANNTLMEHFKSHYKIADIVHEGIGEALFDYGAYALLVVPDTALDDIILDKQIKVGKDGGPKLTKSAEAMHLSVERNLNDQLKPLGLIAPQSATKDAKHSEEAFSRFKMSFESHHELMEGESTPAEGDLKALSSIIEHISITDNINELKIKALQHEVAIDNVNDVFSAKMQSLSSEALTMNMPGQRINKKPQSELDEKLSKPVRYQEQTVVSLKPADQYGKKTKGEPLVMKVPAASMINVMVPGTTNKFIAHYIILDENGYFVDPWNHDVDELLMADRGPSTMNAEQGTVINAHRNIFGYDNRGKDRAKLRQAITKTYTDIIEEELKQAVEKGAFDNNVDINLKDRIGQLMLARALKGQKTKFLFVPTSQMSYIHYELDEDGVGLSLMSKTKLLGSIRAVLMLASIMSNVRRAVDTRDVTITVEDEDQDPKATVSDVVDLLIRAKNNESPIGDTSWTSIVESLGRSGINIQTKGGNWPSIEIEKGQSQLNINAEVSKELLEDVKRQHYQAMYLPAEQADATGEIKFAQIAIQDNILFAKRIMFLQSITEFHFSDHAHKYVKSNGPLTDKLDTSIAEALKALKKDAKKELASLLVSRGFDGITPEMDFASSEKCVEIVRNMLVGAFKLILPSPEISKHELLSKDMESYATWLDAALDVYIGKEYLLLTDATMAKLKKDLNLEEGGEEDVIKKLKELLKQRLMRQWMMDNTVGMEVMNIFNPLEDDKEAALTSIIQHSDALKAIIDKLQLVKKEESEPEGDDLGEEEEEIPSEEEEELVEEENTEEEEEPEPELGKGPKEPEAE